MGELPRVTRIYAKEQAMKCSKGHELTCRQDALGGWNRDLHGRKIYSCPCGVYFGDSVHEEPPQMPVTGAGVSATLSPGATNAATGHGEASAKKPEVQPKPSKRGKGKKQDIEPVLFE